MEARTEEIGRGGRACYELDRIGSALYIIRSGTWAMMGILVMESNESG